MVQVEYFIFCPFNVVQKKASKAKNTIHEFITGFFQYSISSP